MNIRTAHAPRREGYTLVIVLLMIVVSLIAFQASLTRTYTEAHLNERNNQYVAGQNAAEAATELAIARMRYDYLVAGLGAMSNNLPICRTNLPNVADNSYWGNYRFSDGQGHANQIYVQCISNTTWGPLQSGYPGLYAWFPTYRVIANATWTNSSYRITNAVQQDLTFNAIPIFQFAIFYNSLMEYTWCAAFTINGRVHANGSIYTGSVQPLIFNGQVTTTSSISSPGNDGHTPGQYTDRGTFSGGAATNGYILLPLGTNNVHALIDQPPSNELPNSQLGSNRLYNLAHVVMLVSNSSVTVRIQNSQNGQIPGMDTTSNVLTITNLSAGYLKTNLPFLSITNSFRDQRESKTAYVTQIDVAKYSNWLSTNGVIGTKFTSGTYPTILYVADNRSSNSSSAFTAVRLANGATTPSNGGLGFTVVTPDPLYVWGNYNQPTSSYLGTTNTTTAGACSVMSDAVTILSPNWQDSQSTLTLGNGSKSAAADDTVNAAIISGIVYSTGTNVNQFSGGVMNLPRLLEDWGNSSLTLNTSIVNLFASTMATNQFKDPGNYYYAPQHRYFSFDLNFTSPTRQPPPGTPNLNVMLRTSWASVPANKVDYYVTP